MPIDPALLEQLGDCDEFFRLPELAHLPPDRRRVALAILASTGSYWQTAEEIAIGARLAWRNADRCVGRAMWRALTLRDARHVRTPRELAEACWDYMAAATNGGAIRPMILVGPPRPVGGDGMHILSPQLIRYAGYRNPDGSVTGDPLHIELTELAEDLGWHGERTPFDILPVMIHSADRSIDWFEVPREVVLEVAIEHPEFDWFADLGLKWHALPAISNMRLEVGGLSYLTVFSGNFVETEIASRNLTDANRYNTLPLIGELMGLDQSHERTLWRDRALVELNRAVLHSFRKAGARIVDHHSVAKQFCDHVDREKAAGRGCPTDWSWVNPPISSGLTPTFHRYYDPPDPDLRPAFVRDEVSDLALRSLARRRAEYDLANAP
ncbi:nitric oxide synthase oxygenase [Nocardia sp. CDC159]|uniref:Nitric oxide synthase oxygenase n=1 Tax=Nocardia pulmonis TaxID=2951408 RepID=A0A9X2E1D8_9NOCA|nr:MULTISPECIES: nitric oxide synthase oxygenase [Nocardia]MCM6772394.1 nitric oxide synthase oxygenase [Nocardia pulmonis]MCM6784948.1 nitric oxide synthase oxygenase [Nocardia sp. CDC159]